MPFHRCCVSCLLKEKWATVPAAPVVVLPYESDETVSGNETMETEGESERTKNSGSNR